MRNAEDRKKERDAEAYRRGKEDAHKNRSYKEGADAYSHDDERLAYTKGFTDGLKERQ